MTAAKHQSVAETLQITKIKEHIGTIVSGIDLAQPVDAATQEKLYDAVVENVVLVIRGTSARHSSRLRPSDSAS